MKPKLYTVQDLPYRRTAKDLANSCFVKCLDYTQVQQLGDWLLTVHEVGSQWIASWVDEDWREYSVTIQRVE